MEIEGFKMLSKSNFHISLVCIGKIMEEQKISIPHFEDLVIKDFCNFIKDNDVSLIKYSNEFRLVTQNERKSLVLMCEVSNIDKFFDTLNRKYKLSLENQPTHITLYTLQPDMGIFISDSKDLEQLTRVIENPIKKLLFGSN
ncbi:MAG: hypothetical protein WC998_06925 [Candidatus Paceibacterota bacterium]